MTFRLRHPKDGRVHLSDAKRMAITPAHARYFCEHPKPPTPAMTFGSLCDALTLDVGKRNVRVYEGATRRGKEWDAFQADCPADALIVKRDEFDTATAVAAAVHNDPVAGPLLRGGEHQRVVQWDMHGLPWGTGIAGERGGFDVLGPDYIADLKTTTDVEPGAWSRQARRMHYLEQLYCYGQGALAIGHKIANYYLVGVEAKPPHCVTVLQVPQHEIDDAGKVVYGWCERIKQCEAADFWPGHAQSVVEIEPRSAWDMAAEAEDA